MNVAYMLTTVRFIRFRLSPNIRNMAITFIFKSIRADHVQLSLLPAVAVNSDTDVQTEEKWKTLNHRSLGLSKLDTTHCRQTSSLFVTFL